MAAIWVIILLAILQGVLEWLPVSSEGWLILILNWLNEPENALAIALFMHLGTMIAVIIKFRKDFGLLFNYKIWKESKVLKNTDTSDKSGEQTEEYDHEDYKAKEQKTLWKFLILATLATAVIGVPLYLLLKFVLSESAFYFAGGAISGGDIITLVIGLLLIGTGIFILVARKNKTAKKSLIEMTTWEMLITGAVQGLTILPGVSRSGSTVSTLLIEGIEEEDALRGSFLLSVPAILGANILTLIIDLAQGEFSFIGIPWYAMIIAFLLSGIVGYLTIDLFLWIARKLNFGWFCISIGILAVIITIIFIILSLVSIG